MEHYITYIFLEAIQMINIAFLDNSSKYHLDPRYYSNDIRNLIEKGSTEIFNQHKYSLHRV